MISVVLYGRNDSYGYNLHKRAVLSLNCIAELLDDADDEILFVDYNTPDDLPTFVEAVADLLTAKAKQLTRVLRIRTAQHARFAGLTHLKALEAPARNAAIRRSNENNRWILSTNTDMVFLPRSAQSLSGIASLLPDGLYHTARFELPEILWETLDRKDPQACIDGIRYWGGRLQLQEVVYGTPYTLFDGPGDFQLFLRSDAFRISGFDERMLLGWHCDTNIARRFELLRGEPVKSALDHVFSFHCDHNRETTPAHAHGAVQNDWQTFVNDLQEAAIPEQRDSWGFAGESIEEIRIEEKPKIVGSLEAMLPPMSVAYYVTSIAPELYHDFRYDPEHVVPYIANVIAALPKHWNVYYAGCRKRTFGCFRELWNRLGFSGRILVPDYIAGMILHTQETERVSVVDEARAHEEADFFIFEIGAGEDDAAIRPVGARATPEEGMHPLSRADQANVRIVHRAYVRAVAAERAHRGPQRRFVLVNMQGNPTDSTVESRVGASWTPMSTHVRHGYVLPDPFLERRTDAVTWMQQRLRAPWQPNKATLGVIARKIASRATPEEYGDYLRTATWLIDLLQAPDAADVLDATKEYLSTLVAYLERHRVSAAADKYDLNLETLPARRTSLSRVAAIEDFDDPHWGSVAVRVVGVGPVNTIFARVRFPWESTHIVYSLEKAGALNGSIGLLQHPGGPRNTAQRLVGTLIDWAGQCALFDVTRPVAQGAVHDGIVVAAPVTTDPYARQIPSVMALADGLLKPGGICLFVLDVALRERGGNDIDLDVLGSGIFGEQLRTHTAWELCGPLELGLSAATLDLATPGDVDTIVRYDAGVLRTSCILAWEKKGATTSAQWDRYRQLYLDQRPALVRA